MSIKGKNDFDYDGAWTRFFVGIFNRRLRGWGWVLSWEVKDSSWTGGRD